MEEKNIEPYNDTLAALSIGHSKNLELDMAETLLEKISGNLPKYIRPFNALLAACDVMVTHILPTNDSMNWFHQLFYLCFLTFFSSFVSQLVIIFPP